MRDGLEPEVDGVDHQGRSSKDEQAQRFLDGLGSPGAQHSLTEEQAQSFLVGLGSSGQRQSLTDQQAQGFLDRLATSGQHRAAMQKSPEPDWRDPEARRDWYEERISNPAYLVPESHHGPAYDYQRRESGSDQVRLEGGGKKILADGLTLDPDTVVALETKYVVNPGKKSIYEGGRPDFLYEDFDDEMKRYASVVREPANPIDRIRIITNTPKAAAFLSARAHRIVGTDVDIDTIVRP